MGPPHTNTIVLTAQIESKFITEDDLVPFRCSPIPLCATPLQTEAPGSGVLLSAHVMGAAIPNVLQPGALSWFWKTQGPVVKVLPISDDRGRRRRRRLFPEGREKKINHDVRVESNQENSHKKTGREDVAQSTKRSNEAERRRGEGKNAGRKAGRPKAVNQGGEISPKNPE
ncbi:hypothetical protein TNCV_2979581 [Trichonephila clavipes]|nr:hypothetical protein TNCV_2979581 [Trichonephila clavipes]